MRRTPLYLGMLLVLCLTLGAPAKAKSKSERACKPFRPPANWELIDPHAGRENPVHVITDDMTEQQPLVLEYQHGIANDSWIPGVDEVDHEEKYFNFQVRSKKRSPSLHIRIEWPVTSPSDIDLHLYDAWANQVAASDSFNLPAPDGSTGGWGFEYIGYDGASNCDGFSLLSFAARSLGTDVTLKAWLAE